MPDDFDGETPDQKRAAEKRKAAAEAARVNDEPREEPTPKGRRAKADEKTA